MSATETHHPYWVDAAKEIKEVKKENGDEMDVNTESSLELCIKIEKVLKKSYGQMQQMLEKVEDDGARALSNARGADLPGPVLALDEAETRESLTNSLAELNQLAKDVQAVYESFNAADSQRKKRKADEVSQEQSKKHKTQNSSTDTSVAQSVYHPVTNRMLGYTKKTTLSGFWKDVSDIAGLNVKEVWVTTFD